MSTPLDLVVDEDGVTALRAADASGSFGLLQNHEDFLTGLATTIVRWTAADGSRRFCAVRRGVLAVTAGQDIAIATREAIRGDDLASLAQTVLARFQADAELERTGRFENTRLQLSAIRHIVEHLRPTGQGGRFT